MSQVDATVSTQRESQTAHPIVSKAAATADFDEVALPDTQVKQATQVDVPSTDAGALTNTMNGDSSAVDSFAGEKSIVDQGAGEQQLAQELLAIEQQAHSQKAYLPEPHLQEAHLKEFGSANPCGA